MTESLHQFLASYYRLRPVNATFTGIHEFDDRLPDWSPEGIAAAVDEMRTLRAALTADDHTSIRDVQARDRALALAFLDIQIAECEEPHFLRSNPSLAIGEAAFALIALMTRPFADAETRARNAAARLEGFPAFLDGARRSCGRAVPLEWRLKALRECEGLIRLLTDGVPTWLALEQVSDALAAALTNGARAALATVERHRGWLNALPADGPTRYSAGPELFDLLLKRGHWCDRARDDLARQAAAQLDEALANLQERARRTAAGGWPEVQARLADAHPAADDYLASYARIWEACGRTSDEHQLVTWPHYPIRYVPIPMQTRTAAPFLYYLFYRSPAPFDALPVHDYVVTPVDGDLDPADRERRLRANNFSVITLNHVVHHGAIGHHVQNYYAYRGESAIGRIAAVDCASRIGMFCGGTMAEGWACYATDLMDEVGFLTPDQSLAQQHTRARLLARAVVDIGLHGGSLDFDAAVRLYHERIGMSEDAARAEVCKNSMFPATAVMYWLGTEGLHRLRRECSSGLTLRQFHDRVLSFGSIPVPLLARVWS